MCASERVKDVRVMTLNDTQTLAHADEEVYLCTTEMKSALPALLMSHPTLLFLHIHNSSIMTVCLFHTRSRETVIQLVSTHEPQRRHKKTKTF